MQKARDMTGKLIEGRSMTDDPQLDALSALIAETARRAPPRLLAACNTTARPPADAEEREAEEQALQELISLVFGRLPDAVIAQNNQALLQYMRKQGFDRAEPDDTLWREYIYDVILTTWFDDDEARTPNDLENPVALLDVQPEGTA